MPFLVDLTLGYIELQSKDGQELIVSGSESSNLSLDLFKTLKLDYPSSIDFPGDKRYEQAVFTLHPGSFDPTSEIWVTNENKKVKKPLLLNQTVYSAVIPIIYHDVMWYKQKYVITVKKGKDLSRYGLLLNLLNPKDPPVTNFIGPKECFGEKS